MTRGSRVVSPSTGNTTLAGSLAEYESVISDEYAPLSLETRDKARPFQSMMRSRALGWMRLSKVYASAGFSGYRRAKSTLDRRESLVLMLVEDGWFSVIQHGRKADCGENSLVLLDCDSAMEAVQEGATSALAYKMPKGILRAQYDDIDMGFASAVDASEGSPAILRDLMLSVWRNQEALGDGEIAHLPSSLLNLVGLVFLSDSYAKQDTSSLSYHYRRVENAIDAEISNPELSPAKVASDLGISKSYLFAATKWGGNTFGRMVMERRLEHCRESLSDPANLNRSITDIALGWGFQNPSHFSRCFAERFGMTPSQYREQLLLALRPENPLEN